MDGHGHPAGDRDLHLGLGPVGLGVARVAVRARTQAGHFGHLHREGAPAHQQRAALAGVEARARLLERFHRRDDAGADFLGLLLEARGDERLWWVPGDGSGNWSNVDRPETGVGSGTAATQARDRAAAGGGATAGTRPTTTDRPGQAGAGISSTDRGTVDQLNRDARARTEGSQRTRDYGTVRSSPTPTRTAGSYRPSGGGMRAGGGGRRR